jgi:two-component system, sensor histidine kinase and response regulator
MLSSPDLSFSRTLPLSLFNQLGELLLQMAQSVEKAPLLLTEEVLTRIKISGDWQIEKFTVVVSQGFSALLIGSLTPNVLPQVSLSSSEDGVLNAMLTFNQEAIASFLLKLKELFECDSDTHQNLEDYLQTLKPNDAKLQGEFTLLLLEYLLPQSPEQTTTSASSDSHISGCQVVEDALRKQIAQERLLNQVTTQIRKSLDLSVIMTTVVGQVREFLELDRLVIYKFEESKVYSSHFDGFMDAAQPKGSIVCEVRADDAILSVLNYTKDTCFAPGFPCWEKYRQGFTLAVDDVEKTYALSECLLNFLHISQVRAKLAAPIMFENKLWGLLIAHQCNAPRYWTENEKNLLTSIAEQLAIAIHQSELMRSLTLEKQSLEQRVIERTMDLHDALLAAEAAGRLRSEFLATISHELLTPLTYVIGMSSTLLRWPLGELSQRQRDYLQTIHDSGEHLLGLINDILDLSQIEAGKTVLNISEFSLVDIAETTVQSLLKKAAIEQVNLKLDLQIDQQRQYFTADARRVQQIISNLLSNGIKFTPQGGDVILRLWLENNTAVFQIEDTGIGIAEEQLPLLFEKFHQLDTPYRRRYEGTGLGLALTKQLVELHRGRIEVESSVGAGSIFTVLLPCQPN